MVKLGRLVEARFIRRLNRFAALVDISGQESLVHVANSGRMRELLVEGRRVYLAPAPGDHRKTAFDLALVDLGHTLASADARLPNKLVHEAQVQGRLDCFAGYDGIRLEATYGDSRLDMALSRDGATCLVEVKSVTLVVDGAGIFPDAPTSRGRKHVLTLAGKVKEGYRGRRSIRGADGRMPALCRPTMSRTPTLALPCEKRWRWGWKPTPSGVR